MKVPSKMLNRAIQIPSGTGGGARLKYAVNLPNRLTVRLAAGSNDLIPKIPRSEVHGDPEGGRCIYTIVVLSGKLCPTGELKSIIWFG